MLGVEKYFFISDTVRTVLPLSSFLLMAFLAAADHVVHVNSAEANGVAISAANVLNEAADISQMKAGIKGEEFAVALSAFHIAMTGSLPGGVLGADFMTAGAGFSSGIFVIEAGSGKTKNNQDGDGDGEESQTGVEESHG